jgi:hypothetical protein
MIRGDPQALDENHQLQQGRRTMNAEIRAIIMGKVSMYQNDLVLEEIETLQRQFTRRQINRAAYPRIGERIADLADLLQ